MSNTSEPQQQAGRPTLVIGSTERAIEDIRAGATADTSALLKAEIERCRASVRQSFEGIKETLVAIERSCTEALGAGSTETSAALGTVVERLVAAATAASEAAAHRARAEARVEVDELQVVLARIRDEQDLEREQLKSLGDEIASVNAQLKTATDELASVSNKLKTTTDELGTERAARAQLEAAVKQAEQARQALVTSHQEEKQALTAKHDSQLRALLADLEAQRGELARLQRQAETERAERARLVAAIQQVVAPGDAIGVVAATAASVPVPVEPPVHAVAPPPPAAKAGTADAPAEAHDAAEPESDPELVVYVEHLLKTVETMYSEDVAARRKSDDVLSRLTDNLRSARNVFRNHVGATDPEELTLFDYQLTKLLNTTEDTAFGRHLGIAAYECQKARRS